MFVFFLLLYNLSSSVLCHLSRPSTLSSQLSTLHFFMRVCAILVYSELDPSSSVVNLNPFRRLPNSVHRILISKLFDGGYGNYPKENNEKIQTLSLSARCYATRHHSGMKRWMSNCLSIIRLWRLTTIHWKKSISIVGGGNNRRSRHLKNCFSFILNSTADWTEKLNSNRLNGRRGRERKSLFLPIYLHIVAIRIVIHRLRSVMMGQQLKQLQVDF